MYSNVFDIWCAQGPRNFIDLNLWAKGTAIIN